MCRGLGPRAQRGVGCDGTSTWAPARSAGRVAMRRVAAPRRSEALAI
jgi:hypothetical protein